MCGVGGKIVSQCQYKHCGHELYWRWEIGGLWCMTEVRLRIACIGLLRVVHGDYNFTDYMYRGTYMKLHM
jgi:hypothetical protein